MPGREADEDGVSVDDFYASAPAVPPSVGLPTFGVAQPPAVRPAPARTPLWPWAAAGAGLLALIVVLAVVLWPHSSKPSGPDPSTARLFGQQTRVELPQPVTSADCAAAVKAFPAIAADVRARAAFVDGCTHG